YGEVPLLPWEYSLEQGERFVGEESDAWILLEDMVERIDPTIANLLDYGDIDYFGCDKCKMLKDWLDERRTHDLSPRLKELYGILYDYLTRAIELKTGVVIEL
ncbi:MAG: hypothetical protein HUJ70_14460, partial [Pseudobutyrivibrio sp.]|nr:hypothetical protein [Pseudobutyrivibrio sp.]